MSEAARQTVARRHPVSGMPHPALAELTFPTLTVEPVSRMLALQFQFERSEWWPAARLAEEQNAQLAIVLAHAFETTPYYRTLFTRAGVRRPAEVDAGFLRSLPITKRADIQAAGRDLVSQRHPKEHGPVTFARTSGSTGLQRGVTWTMPEQARGPWSLTHGHENGSRDGLSQSTYGRATSPGHETCRSRRTWFDPTSMAFQGSSLRMTCAGNLKLLELITQRM